MAFRETRITLLNTDGEGSFCARSFVELARNPQREDRDSCAGKRISPVRKLRLVPASEDSTWVLDIEFSTA